MCLRSNMLILSYALTISIQDYSILILISTIVQMPTTCWPSLPCITRLRPVMLESASRLLLACTWRVTQPAHRRQQQKPARHVTRSWCWLRRCTTRLLTACSSSLLQPSEHTVCSTKPT